MPKLSWIGKAAVKNHHLEVPYRLLHCNGNLSAGDADAGNLLVQGDNLEALKSLLPYYAGKVNCIYIDPPYNTGSEGWAYNDKVNSPQIRRWLNKVVGKEEEDLCRHDKWLCMMYPRLLLLRKFLREDGVIFVSIDDNEQHHLRMLMDEIFGRHNFVNLITIIANLKGNNSDKFFSGIHEYGMIYAKDKSQPIVFNTLADSDDWENWQEDENGYWKRGGILSATIGKTPKDSTNNFPIYVSSKDECFLERRHEKDVELFPISKGKKTRWYWSPKVFAEQEKQKNILVVRTKKGVSLYKKQRLNLSGIPQAIPKTVFYNPSYGQGSAHLEKAIGQMNSFQNPKSVDLIKDIIRIFTNQNSLILDSFAGSGTTAHAVLQQNKDDGGNRRFVLVEMDEQISSNITAQRIQRVIKGHKDCDKKTAALGSGFRYCTLGKPLFNEFNGITTDVKFNDIAAHIFFFETGSPIPEKPKNALLGLFEGRAIYLLYNGIMGDKSHGGGNMLTSETLHKLPTHPDGKPPARVIYGEGCFLSEEQLQQENIQFRQIPYEIKTR